MQSTATIGPDDKLEAVADCPQDGIMRTFQNNEIRIKHSRA
jgi:hypothetical protein